MKFPNKIIPLSIILLFIVGIYGQTQQTSFSFNQDLLNQVQLPKEDNNQISNTRLPNFKSVSEVTSGPTTLTTDADTYAPGDWVTITAESNTDDMNGSLEWRVESPISEVSFDFKSYYQDVFVNPEFETAITTDWENDGFDFISAADGYLNITEEADPDLNAVEVYNNNSALATDTKYRVTFDYFSQGENMLINPSFETGNLTGWSGVGTAENISIINEAKNASEGNYYAKINATEGFILNQTIPITGQSDGRSFTFTARATGNTDANYWQLRLEAINSSGDVTASRQSADSRNLATDEDGYITINLDWALPENTTSLKAIFFGRDGGSDADGYYTGWLDNCLLAEDPTVLIFSYGSDGNWENNTLIAGTHEWESVEFIFETFENIPSITKTLRFILKDSNSYSNNKTSYWLIDNIAVNIVTKTEDFTGPISNNEARISGYVNSTFFHRDFREELSSTFIIDIDSPENTSVASEARAEIKVQLPSHQVYMGTWIFVFKIHQIDTAEPPTRVATKTVNISFVVEEPLNFVVQDYYLLRGSTNRTENNETIFTEYFEQETEIESFSPGDNVTVLGFLAANSTPTEWYDLEYLDISAVLTSYMWESTWESEEVIFWDVFSLIPYDSLGKYVIDGNFTSPLNNTQTIGLNFQIPNRGIFGNISANITMSLTGTNVKPNGVGDPLLSLNVPISLPRVEFRINVTEENLPETSYYLTDYIGGNVTLEFLNVNNTLETNYPNRNITTDLQIPIKDIDLVLFLGRNESSEIEIAQEFHYHSIGNNTIVWFDYIDPNVEIGMYTFHIRWNTPFSQNATNFADVPISEISLNVQGTLEIVSPGSTPTVKQGEQIIVNFTVQLLETTKQIGGLDLISRLVDEETEGNLIVYEQQGVYYIDIVVGKTMEAKNYNIEILVSGRTEAIGTIEFTVQELEVEPENQLDFFEILVNVAGFGIFVALGVIVVVLMFRLNKS